MKTKIPYLVYGLKYISAKPDSFIYMHFAFLIIDDGVALGIN